MKTRSVKRQSVKRQSKTSTLIAFFLLFSLMACNTGPQPVARTTLSEITPSTGTNSGGVEVTLKGTNIFQALSEDYDEELSITVCGEALENLSIDGIERIVRAPNGQEVSVLIGTVITGTTSKVANPKSSSVDVVLTRPDGTIVVLEEGFTCNDAPSINTTTSGVLELSEGPVNLNLNSIIEDIDGDTFSVTIEGLPTSLNFDPLTLKLTGNLTNNDIGNTNIAVTIIDSDGQAQVYPLQLQVNDRPSLNDANFTVREAAQTGAVIVKLRALDQDDNEFSYKILSGNTDNTFAVNATTGELFINKRLNHDEKTSFQLQLEVSDSVGLSDTANITVSVTRDTTVYNWTMGNPWPTNDAIYDLVTGAFNSTLVPQLRSRSNSQINLTIADAPDFDPELLDKVSAETYDMAHTASYLHLSKGLANAFFTSQPFGLSEAQHKAWLAAEGQALWNELNAPHNLIAFRAGTSGEKGVGWFRSPINSPAQLPGLRWRVNGFGKDIAQTAGATITTEVDVGPLPSALIAGTIDAVRLSGPYVDKVAGLPQAANSVPLIYYTAPDWAERSATLALYTNLDKYNALPVRLQIAIREAAEITAQAMSNQFAALNAQALQEFRANPNITVAAFPASVRSALEVHANSVKDIASAADPFYAKVYESWKQYR